MPALHYGRHTPAEIHWEGDSREVLSGFPRDVKLSLGYSLRRLQNGEFPACETRSMTSIGKGVWELKESDERAWYRVLYLADWRRNLRAALFRKGKPKDGQP
jgi:phage-related protein